MTRLPPAGSEQVILRAWGFAGLTSQDSMGEDRRSQSADFDQHVRD